MNKPKSFKKSKSSFIKKRPKKTMSSKSSKSFVKKVQAIVHRDAETKQSFTSINNVAFNSGINSSGDCLQLIANIAQGTADNARIGDQIRAQSIVIKGAINSNLTFQSYSNCRLGVRLMIVQPKSYNSLSAIQANVSTWSSTLLKKGGTTTAFTGAMNDLWSPINTDAITKYYDKVFYINTPYVASSVGDLSTYNSVKFFRHTFKLRNKLIKYDSSIDSGLTPTNYNPVMLMGYCHLDGSSGDTVTTQVLLSFDSIMNYEDA